MADEVIEVESGAVPAVQDPGGALMEFEAQLLADAADEAAKEQVGFPWISIRNKEFSFSGEVIGDEVTTIIMLAAYENSFYQEIFDADNPVPPSCFALGYDQDRLAPVVDQVEKAEAEACASCWANKFGSADKGKGKACKNSRRLALLEPEAASPEDASIAFLRLPPTSLGNFSKYVKKLATLGKRPTYAVVTKLSFDKDEAYPVIRFEAVQRIDDRAKLTAIMKVRESVRESLTEPFRKREVAEGEEAEHQAPKSKKRKY